MIDRGKSIPPSRCVVLIVVIIRTPTPTRTLVVSWSHQRVKRSADDDTKPGTKMSMEFLDFLPRTRPLCVC
jgi:hypothetical protein